MCVYVYTGMYVYVNTGMYVYVYTCMYVYTGIQAQLPGNQRLASVCQHLDSRCVLWMFDADVFSKCLIMRFVDA